MPDNRKDKTGGRKPGAGRPKGSKNIHSHKAYKKLEELGFDPIEMMVEKYHEIQKKLDYLETIGKHASGAYAQMIATQGTLINNLMQYGYKKIPEKVEQEVTASKPMAVKLTLKGEKKDGESKPEEVGES